jgi:hypothetical protein
LREGGDFDFLKEARPLRSKSYLSETAKPNGLPIVYGDPGAGLQPVSVTVNTNNFPADRLTAYR